MAPERGRWGKRRRMVPPGMPGEVPGSPGVRGGGPSWVQIKFSPHNQPMFEGGAPPLGTPRGPQGQGVRAWGARPGKSWRPRGGPGGPGKGIIEKSAIEKDKCIIEKRTIEKSILARLRPPGGCEENYFRTASVRRKFSANRDGSKKTFLRTASVRRKCSSNQGRSKKNFFERPRFEGNVLRTKGVPR